MKALSVVAFQCIAIVATAQTVQYATRNVYLSAGDAQAILVPPAAPSTIATFTVDHPSAMGGDFFDVVEDNPQVIVSLILPNGTEVTAATAQNVGFTFTSFAGSGSDSVPFHTPGNRAP
jgi:hypothetical protein